MRIAIVGAGGVGALLGALLARAGHDVGFLARGEPLRALVQHGVRVVGASGDVHAPRVRASDSPQALGTHEVVLVAVKAWQVDGAVESVRALLADGGFAVPLQNGVDAARQLTEALGSAMVVGGLCHMVSFIESPGVVRHSGAPPSVTVGELDGSRGGRLPPLVESLVQSGIRANIADDIHAALWEKLLFVGPLGGVGAVTRVPVGVVRSIPETRALLIDAMREVSAVATARGVRISPSAVDAAIARVDGLPDDATASMQRDLMAGKPSEIEFQCGAVVRLGKEAGVPTPTHAFLLAALRPQEMLARR